MVFWFIENTDGTMVDGFIVGHMRYEAKHVWKKMYEKYGAFGHPWKNVTPKYQEEFWNEIEAKFPVLRLCDSHYKADSFATTDYSHWINAKLIDDATKIKDVDEASDMFSRKHTHSPSPTVARKAARNAPLPDSEPRSPADNADNRAESNPPSSAPTLAPSLLQCNGPSNLGTALEVSSKSTPTGTQPFSAVSFIFFLVQILMTLITKVIPNLLCIHTPTSVYVVNKIPKCQCHPEDPYPDQCFIGGANGCSGKRR